MTRKVGYLGGVTDLNRQGHHRSPDRLTICAIAIMAACLSTTAHEAVGHGSACLVSGGQIQLLTSVIFDCSQRRWWITLAGPIGNLTAAGLSAVFLSLLRSGRPHLRLLLLLTMAFGIFWEAGYLLYSAVLQQGDWAIVASIFIASPPVRRVGCVALGVGFYFLGVRAAAKYARPFGPGQDTNLDPVSRIFRTGWLSATLAMSAAALAYAPDRLFAIRQAALEIGAASVPLILMRNRAYGDIDQAPLPLTYGSRWIALGAMVYFVFVATLGHGIAA